MIRATLLKVVHDVLESHPFFATEDFVVREFANQSKEPCVSIKYRYDDSFFFSFHVPKTKTKSGDYSGSYMFSCTANPGRESAVETFTAEERSGLIAEIGAWLGRLHEDVVSAPVARQFDEHARSIDLLRERLEKIPSEPLSREEMSKYVAALDQLKVELVEQLRRETADKDTLKGRIEELGRDVEFLKSTLGSMNKRTWTEAFATRLQRWTSRFSLRQLAAGARAAKALMPASVAEQLDVVSNVATEVANIAEGTPKTGSDGDT
ncbi:hypothetical protein WMF45_42870 [Sorangium sp. So ce448]|uniref:hypothetical protein n=1 Tax=Sorangium sp. So ce448 TaxID=3133314 RepID=UPI003F60E5C0